MHDVYKRWLNERMNASVIIETIFIQVDNELIYILRTINSTHSLDSNNRSKGIIRNRGGSLLRLQRVEAALMFQYLFW